MSNAKLVHDNGEVEFVELAASDGESGWDVGMLLKDTKHVAYDPGFVNTATCRSSITYIDGDAGILRYRGYPIEQLAAHSTFTEVSYLLIYGELPTADELRTFEDNIRQHTMLHEDLRRFFDGFPRDAHPLPVLSWAVAALSTF
jgi:citrate synthase